MQKHSARVRTTIRRLMAAKHPLHFYAFAHDIACTAKQKCPRKNIVCSPTAGNNPEHFIGVLLHFIILACENNKMHMQNTDLLYTGVMQKFRSCKKSIT